MPDYKVYKDPQRSMDLRVAFWLLYFSARIIPGKVCREEFIAQVVADLISEPDAYEDGLFLNVIHCASVGVAAVAINETCFVFMRKLAVAVGIFKKKFGSNTVKKVIRKTKSDINHIEHERNKKKSVICKGYILFREALEISWIKLGKWLRG